MLYPLSIETLSQSINPPIEYVNAELANKEISVAQLRQLQHIGTVAISVGNPGNFPDVINGQIIGEIRGNAENESDYLTLANVRGVFPFVVIGEGEVRSVKFLSEEESAARQTALNLIHEERFDKIASQFEKVFGSVKDSRHWTLRYDDEESTSRSGDNLIKVDVQRLSGDMHVRTSFGFNVRSGLMYDSLVNTSFVMNDAGKIKAVDIMIAHPIVGETNTLSSWGMITLEEARSRGYMEYMMALCIMGAKYGQEHTHEAHMEELRHRYDDPRQVASVA